jgi:hypothetical protein
MTTNFNTLALAYTNDKGELVAWSADTFGSPREYPKTYRDTPETRAMLSRKLNTRKPFGTLAHKLISEANAGAGAIMEASLSGDDKFFAENVTGYVLVTLDLVTDYTRGVDLPKWEDVESCVNNKQYQIL